jgi:hypothetical protein
MMTTIETALADAILDARASHHKRAYLTQALQVATPCGAGQLVYITDDGFAGVQLAGETRIDEYSLAHLTER